MARSSALLFPLMLLVVMLGIPTHAYDSTVGDLICHSSDPAECYPRLFAATDEFQVIHDDQEIPPGLHVRLDITTGRKEAKLYDAATDADDPALEAVEVVPGEGPVDVPVEAEGRSGSYPQPQSSKDPVQAILDAYGPVKAPSSAVTDRPMFEQAVRAIRTSDGNDQDLLAELAALRDLTDDMYWGVQLAKDEAAVRRLCSLVVAAHRDALHRRGEEDMVAERSIRAASVLASSMRNNVPALLTMLGYEFAASGTEFTGTVYDAAIRALHLDEDDAASAHIATIVPAKAYARYLSLLSPLVGATESQRQHAIPHVRRLAGPSHFDAPRAGATPEWDTARQRLVQFVTDHYTLVPVGQPKTNAESERVVDSELARQCELLETWSQACSEAETAYRAAKDRTGGENAIKEACARIRSVWTLPQGQGGCKVEASGKDKVRNYKVEL